MHRALHYFPYLYRHLHAMHHQIKEPCGYAALFQSSNEALIETFGLTTVFFVTGFFFEEFMIVTTMAVIATVCDHTGGSTFHAIHHTLHPHRNFQQPFFTYYDYMFGTIAPSTRADAL